MGIQAGVHEEEYTTPTRIPCQWTVSSKLNNPHLFSLVGYICTVSLT